MAEGNDQEKTEQATPKKREEARRKGQIAQSQEIPTVAILLSALTYFFFGGTWMFHQLTNVLRRIFQDVAQTTVSIASIQMLLWRLFQESIVLLIPLFLVVMVAGVASNIAQFGFMITGEPLVPKFSKMDPIKGFKNLISLRGLVELVKSVIKIVIIGGMAYRILKGEFDRIPGLIDLTVIDMLAFAGSTFLKLGFYTCLVLVFLAGLDFTYQYWQHEKDLRMSKQEVKDEYKQREGDPKIKARIRSAQREMAMRRMMQAVPDATVVITNPTHLAIALKFERNMPAPVVVAKGAGRIAERIREIATQNDIPIVEQKPLARTIYKTVEINQSIPAELYHAVAEVLAYVYRLKGYSYSAA
jgi:flagellar biosynthetic protein FlhB